MNIERLEQVVSYLKAGSILQGQFTSYRCNWVPYLKRLRENRIGLEGNVIGQLPAIFPNDWKFGMPQYQMSERRYLGYEAYPFLKGHSELAPPLYGIVEFFELEEELADHFFCTAEQWPEMYGGEIMTNNSELPDWVRHFEKTLNRQKEKKTNAHK